MTRKITAEAQFNLTVSTSIESGMSEDDAMLAALMGDLEVGAIDSSDEIIEPAAEDEPAAIEAAVAEIEKAEANQAIYAGEEVDETGEADAPQVPTEAAAPTKAELKAAKAAEKAAAKAAAKLAAAPKEPKEVKPARVTYVGHTTSEVLVAKLGTQAADILLLEAADTLLAPDDLKAKQDVLLSDIDKLAKKVGEKSVMLFGWLRNGGQLNDVMRRAFTVLARDGELVSGKKGNLYLNLRERLSEGTSDSQSNQIFMLFPALSIAKKEKGKVIANPNSLILMKARAELVLA